MADSAVVSISKKNPGVRTVKVVRPPRDGVAFRSFIPAETTDKKVEKYPAVFEIDELRCVVCGLCVEACPCDAIRMDTGKHAPPVEERADGVIDKDAMLAMGTRSIAVQGGTGPEWRRG